MTTIVLLQNDLRLFDNPALAAACHDSNDVIPLYILDDDIDRPLGGAQYWWLHHSLSALQASFAKKDCQLTLRCGETLAILHSIIKSHKIDAIYFNQGTTPGMQALQQKLAETLSVPCQSFSGNLLCNHDAIKNKSGGVFKVYTPFWKHVSALIQPKLTLAPRRIPQQTKLKTDDLDRWQLLPNKPNWASGFDIWTPGEKGAQDKIKAFLKRGVGLYPKQRDFPSIDGTSMLSPHLHFGELSVRHAWILVQQAMQSNPTIETAAAGYLRQLVWREFSYYFLHHFPEVTAKNFRPEFDKFPWQKNKKQLTAWQRGLTGYPIVDAGMRELWHTGYMHNRVRMITASFLTKDLLIDWRQGEAWFWDTLLDADLANNVFGWQWTAGCGADAAPYFRIFNPTLQSQKFDPEGDYIRQWVPELAELPNKYLHDPSSAPALILEAAGITLGKDYPKRIVDHAAARDEALKRFKAL